jgi:hypothetical protein
VADQVAAIVAQLERETAKAGVALVLEIDKELRRAPSQGGTPVATGHARASWLPSVGSPATDEGTEPQHTAAVAALLGYRLADGNLYLTNNAPYIALLNLGWSKQAAIGFVEMAMDRALATIQRKFDGLKIEFGVSAFTDAAGAHAAEGIASSYSPFGGDE